MIKSKKKIIIISFNSACVKAKFLKLSKITNIKRFAYVDSHVHNMIFISVYCYFFIWLFSNYIIYYDNNQKEEHFGYTWKKDLISITTTVSSMFEYRKDKYFMVDTSLGQTCKVRPWHILIAQP